MESYLSRLVDEEGDEFARSVHFLAMGSLLYHDERADKIKNELFFLVATGLGIICRDSGAAFESLAFEAERFMAYIKDKYPDGQVPPLH
jgi:hypothetical protein